MFETHFSQRDIGQFMVAFGCLVISLFFFQREKWRPALWILVFAGFVLRLLMAEIDPFLHLWDEQFHALVAKHMMNDPFHPHLLPEDLLVRDPAYWANCYTWIHKPPLFLWQMALSMKIFGVNTFAVRFPSVLLSTLMIPCMYRTGKLLHGEKTGYIAALLIAFSNIHVNVVSGFLNTDHNDVVFAAYVFFSLWTFTEYCFHPSKKWVILIGIFTATAVLTKWLPGFLVIGSWGLWLVVSKEWRRDIGKWKDFFIAGLTALIIAAPWFIYVAVKWPVQWNAMLKGFSQHINENISHTGGPFYHLQLVVENFGWFFSVLMLAGAVIFTRSVFPSAVKMIFIFSVFAVFVFYSMIPAKMPLFCFIVYPVLILFSAFMTRQIFDMIPSRKKAVHQVVVSLSLFILSYHLLNLGRIEHFHTERDPHEIYRKSRMANRKVFLRFDQQQPDQQIVLFNCGSWNAVHLMFYLGNTAFDDLPTKEDAATLRKLGRKVAVFDDGNLPQWIREDTAIDIIREKLTRNGF